MLSPGGGGGGGGNRGGGGVGGALARLAHASTYDTPSWGYGTFLFGAPSTVAVAVLSDAQCTAMGLLGTLAESVDWAAARAPPATSPLSPLLPVVPGLPRAHGAAAPVAPSAATYLCFAEGLYAHLPACANCLRRCTFTRSSSRPVTAVELTALSRLLQTLRTLFSSMGAGVRLRTGSALATSTTDNSGDCRRTWAQQITDSRVLDVLAHIGTAAELVASPLPRLCILTLRSYLDHVHVLATPPTAPRMWPASEAALLALTHCPSAQPAAAAGPSTWGSGAARESLMVLLLSRMQRRCAGQSVEVSMPLRLDVLTLLVDILGEAVAQTRRAAAEAAGVITASPADAVLRASDSVTVMQRLVTAVVECRVWSGTAQELRYLGPASTPLVKEMLRFICGVAHLVDATVQLWRDTAAAAAAAAATAAPTHPLGHLLATTLVAESTALHFGFHVVTMDLPLTLTGLVNGTRWQPSPTATATTTTAAAAAATGVGVGGGAGRGIIGCRGSSSSSGVGVTSPTSLGTATVRMAPCGRSGATSPPAVPHAFADEDRRETFQIAAAALAELLRCLRRLQTLVLHSPVWPTATAAAVLGSPRSAPVRLPSGRRPHDGPSHTATAATAATTTPAGHGNSPGGAVGAPHQHHHDPQRQRDVVVAPGPSGSSACVVTTTVYPVAVVVSNATAAAVAASIALAPETLAASAAAAQPLASTASPQTAANRSTTATASAAVGSGAAEREVEDANNWRQCEHRWRRRAVCFRTAHSDAVQALELSVLNCFLEVQPPRHDAAASDGDVDLIAHHRDNEREAAVAAVRSLAREKKMFLESV
ncbi:hypothetical protein NESM_000491700 [Novymonas esmeraldas]|uniref:Uncharacterized protein n=1 Tax=Novymonas esmeraldas TaxID=1808958 RepID=A0AAW0EN67_9TRYP